MKQLLYGTVVLHVVHFVEMCHSQYSCLFVCLLDLLQAELLKSEQLERQLKVSVIYIIFCLS